MMRRVQSTGRTLADPRPQASCMNRETALSVTASRGQVERGR
ncbi:hypothetical protein POX_a00210 [Penicillium oxalicum]|nr:hypothetical protein POX_a00210 [Penicillium oxalicum]KAI2793628.1 hypothetical protein POX_a00210 [Penicillium oxalicum]